MERTKQYYANELSKTQQKKRKRKKYPNVFFKKELVGVFENIEDPRIMVASFLTFFCALRMSEICKLKWQEIDLDNKRLKVVDGKNHKDGFIPISSVSIPILRKWKAMNQNEEYFLPSEGNCEYHFKQSSLLKAFKKALTRAGLDIATEKNVIGNQQHQYKFHTLRHSRCTHLLSNGVPIQKVQYFMRHDDINTTMTYTWILNVELNQMVEEVDKKLMYQEGFPESSNSISQTPMTQQPVHSDPLEIARKRLAFGEISPREFKRIVGMLQTPFNV